MKYFLTVILSAKATPAKRKAFSETVSKIIKVLEGKIEKVDEWGEVKLENKVKGHTSGNFLHFSLELTGKGAKALQDKLVVENDIIRHLLVKA